MHDRRSTGLHNYWSGDYHDAFPDEALDVFVKYGIGTAVALRAANPLPWGGAIARVPEYGHADDETNGVVDHASVCDVGERRRQRQEHRVGPVLPS